MERDELPFDELDPCCQREILERRRFNEVSSQLRTVDRSEHRHDMRDNVLMSRAEMERRRFSYCQSCAANVDYTALSQMRRELQREQLGKEAEEDLELTAKTDIREEEEYDSDEEFLREFEEEDREKREQAQHLAQETQRHFQETLETAERMFGLGKHREEDLEHLCALTQEECLAEVGAPLLLHLYTDSHVSAMLDLAIEQLASTKLPGLRCRRLGLRAVWDDIEQSAERLRHSALGRQLLHNRDLHSVRDRFAGQASSSSRRTQAETEGLLLCFAFKPSGVGHELSAVLQEQDVAADSVEDSIPLLHRAIDRAGIAAASPPAFFPGRRQTANEDNEEEEDDGGFNCGVYGCNRRYPHEHVSTSNSSGKPSFAKSQSRMEGAEALAPNVFTRL